MQPSILRNVLFAFLASGVLMASAFPFYASFFVVWKPGMLTWFVVGCVVAGLIMGAFNYAVMSWVLVTKLKRISQVAGAIAQRDLTLTCSIRSDDTLGEIIDNFNQMAEALRELIRHASKLSDAVRNDATAMTAQAGHIHDRVDELAGRTRQIDTAVADLDQAISEITNRAQYASTQALEAGRVAREGVALARESLVGMERVHTTVNEATAFVERLGKSSEEVGAIVSVIKAIADQTNLLALNAAIEAARAGEQGRGFAVVADEVRKLAEKTTEATAQIGGMIQNIQNETRQAVTAIEQGMNEASTGVRHAKNVEQSLELIANGVSELSASVGEINGATSQQSSAVDQVRANVQAISSLNNETLENSREGVALARSLADQVGNLDGAVKSFHLG
jgi:methyl-accepting chemotaxis protein